MNCRQERCRRDLGIKQTRSRTSQTGAQTRTNGRGKGGRGKNSNGRGGCRCAARGAGRQSTTEARRLLAHCAARAALGKAARRSKPGVARGGRWRRHAGGGGNGRTADVLYMHRTDGEQAGSSGDGGRAQREVRVDERFGTTRQSRSAVQPKKAARKAMRLRTRGVARGEAQAGGRATTQRSGEARRLLMRGTARGVTGKQRGRRGGCGCAAQLEEWHTARRWSQRHGGRCAAQL